MFEVMDSKKQSNLPVERDSQGKIPHISAPPGPSREIPKLGHEKEMVAQLESHKCEACRSGSHVTRYVSYDCPPRTP